MTAVFVQATVFTADLKRLRFSDDDLSAMEQAILAAPERWPVMGGTGGLRKMRFAPPSHHAGKSGSCRICYVWFPEDAIVYLVVAFGKGEKDNLSAREKSDIHRLIDSIRGHLIHRRTGHDQGKH